MNTKQFQTVHPVLPSKNVAEAIRYYKKLGFQVLFADSKERPTYAGVARDAVELHLQWHDEAEWERVERPMLRFKINDVKALYQEYEKQDVFHANTTLQKTPWTTEEFAFYDRDGNGLTFYKDM